MNRPPEFIDTDLVFDAPLSHLALALPLHCNTPDEEVADNIRASADRGLPVIMPVRPHDVPAVIVGGGPSVKNDIAKIGSFRVGTIFALNGAGLWLKEQGIVPHAVIILDARQHNGKFITGLDPRVKLYLATQCHPDVFAAAKANGNPVVMWHSTGCELDGVPGILQPPGTVLIDGGTSVGTRALRLVHVLGYRTVHLFGYDSSFAAEGSSHAYPQAENEADEKQGVMVAGRWFVSTPWMIRQADEFQHIAAQLMHEGMSFHVHGDGLLPAVAKEGVRLAEEPLADTFPIHPTAQIHEKAHVDDTAKVGARTRIWQFASVIRGAVLGADCNVASGALLDGPRFGDRCIICQNVAMGPGFLFGNDCFVGPNVTICNDAWPVTSKEGFDIEYFRNGFWTVIVKDGASIGANAVVLPGVTIGAGSMIASGAVVDRSVPDRSVFTRDGQVRPLPKRFPPRMRAAG